jgi:hypothetical protein
VSGTAITETEQTAKGGTRRTTEFHASAVRPITGKKTPQAR